MTDELKISIQKIGGWQYISNELLDPPEPTPEQRAEYARRDAEYAEAFAEFRYRLDLVDDPASRVVLDLHACNETNYATECDGCEEDGEYGPARWPCATVRVLAEHHAIEVPEW